MTNTTVSADQGSLHHHQVSAVPASPWGLMMPDPLPTCYVIIIIIIMKALFSRLLCDAPVADPRRSRHLHRPPP